MRRRGDRAVAFAVSVPMTALIILSTVAASRGRTVQLVREAEAQLAQDAPDEALDLYEQALTHAVEVDDDLGAAAIHNSIGTALESAGRYQEALANYEAGLRTLGVDCSGEDSRWMETLSSRGKTFEVDKAPATGPDLYRGRVDDLQRLFRLPSDAAACELFIYLINNAGNMYLMQRQFESAETLYRHALAAARQQPGQRELDIRGNLAWIAIGRGEFENAARLLDKVLPNDTGANPPSRLRRAYLAAGAALREAGELAKAGSYLRRALSLYEQVSDDRGRPRPLGGQTYACGKRFGGFRQLLLRSPDDTRGRRRDRFAR